MGYPDKLLIDGEQVVTAFRPHWKVLLPAIFALLVAAAAGVAALVVALPQLAEVVVVVLLAVVAVWLAAKHGLRWFATQYVLTSHRLIVRRGIVNRSGTEIPLEQINTVSFSQSLVERLLRYGDLLIESAGSNGQSRLTNIPEPEAFQSRIYAARDRHGNTPSQ